MRNIPIGKDLTTSAIDRQNILNNPYALAEIEKAAGIKGIPFEGKTVVLKEQVAAFFEVTPRTQIPTCIPGTAPPESGSVPEMTWRIAAPQFPASRVSERFFRHPRFQT